MNILTAQERKNLKKSTLRKLRNNGEIPGVVYGSEMKTEPISVKYSALLKVIREVGRNGIISLKLDGKSMNVIIRDVQNDPMTREIIHLDFLQVDKDTKIDTKVSVILKGTSKGEEAGGIVKQYIHELDITARANDIPDAIEIDITDFEIGHTVRIADIKKAYSNCAINHDDEEPILMIDYAKPEAEEEEDSSGVEESEVSSI